MVISFFLRMEKNSILLKTFLKNMYFKNFIKLENIEAQKRSD